MDVNESALTINTYHPWIRIVLRFAKDDIYGAVVMASHSESSPRLFDECRLSAGWPPTPDQACQSRLRIRRKMQLPSASTILLLLSL